MWYHLIKVKALPDYCLELTFKGGEIRVFDFKPYISLDIFSSLRDEKVLQNVWVAFCTVSWGGGIDFDPEVLYSESIPIEEYEAKTGQTL